MNDDYVTVDILFLGGELNMDPLLEKTWKVVEAYNNNPTVQEEKRIFRKKMGEITPKDFYEPCTI